MVSRSDYAVAATKRLADAGAEDAAFDVLCLLEDIGGMPHGHLPDETPLSAAATERLDAAVAARIAGQPLQYILGTWDFLSLRLTVGEGVLIPRPDTELLCETGARLLAGTAAPRVLDLCAGSGCVGLGLASLLPAAMVTAVEKSPAAFGYLRENCARYPQYAVTPVMGDILTDTARFPEGWDAVLSNPPYIRTADLPALMPEVQREPAMALDGGTDGLLFYRALARDWTKKLRPGGFLAVEIGFDEAESVDTLFAENGLVNRQIFKDFAGKNRVVTGYMPISEKK